MLEIRDSVAVITEAGGGYRQVACQILGQERRQSRHVSHAQSHHSGVFPTLSF